MREFPEVGSKVIYTGRPAWGEISGTVVKHYHKDGRGTHNAISMRPDAIPENWPYPGSNTFAPWLEDIRQA